MLEAVLFDWGETLVHWEWDPALLEAGHAAGARAVGREVPPGLTERFVTTCLPTLEAPGSLRTVDYRSVMSRLLAELGIAVDDAELDLFLEAEHAVWLPAHRLASTTHALLEGLRGRGLRLGVVSNAFDPPALLRRDLEQLGIAERIDAAAFASEVGWRKPHPAIFERVLGELGAEAGRTLFVGDSLADDLEGAAALGMHTCQALWFRADDDRDAAEPEFRAFTQMDVLNVVRRLA